ncbi:MAG: S-adenosylmethionine:tRNA ribosyltransferase-isomerase [Solirubrobacteraceae bacterium]
MPAAISAFSLPAQLEAGEPPEARGVRRDGVRLMAAHVRGGRIAHARFRDLPALLEPGDLLVVNASATLPAAIAADGPDGAPLLLHFATRAPLEDGDQWWVLEARSPDGARPARGAERPRTGDTLALAGGGMVEIVAPYARGGRLLLARVETAHPVVDHLGRHGRPIRYGYVEGTWPLGDYQTIFATTPGSAEMPSAGRPFTPALLARLRARGVASAEIVLHTGVSSAEAHEPPYPEQYRVPASTAAQVNAARASGGRIVAVGTTVVRALETVASPEGSIRAGAGWTDLVVTPERPPRAIDGLISGWHEPEASHLQMLEAVAGRELLARCYDAALDHGYLWHEFGDSHLILP